MKFSYVYILASQKNGTLYVGVTSNLKQRISQHKVETFSGFTKKYKVKKLVYYETLVDIEQAISREKKLKRWNRKWKMKLIEEKNPKWRDLWSDFFKP
jgi:putative endonuclease